MPFTTPKAKPRRPKKSLDEATPIQAAVLADLALGFTTGTIARKFGIRYETVQRWGEQFGVPLPHPIVGREKSIPEMGTVILSPGMDIEVGKVQNPSYDRTDNDGNPVPIGQQLMQLLEESLGALRAQVRVATNPVWLERQDGTQLASIHRAIGDTASGLTAAAAAGRQQEAEQDEEDRRQMGNMVEGHLSPSQR